MNAPGSRAASLVPADADDASETIASDIRDVVGLPLPKAPRRWIPGLTIKAETVRPFLVWLADRGVQYVATRAPHELCRFESGAGLGFILRAERAKGWTLGGSAAGAYTAFMRGDPWMEGHNRTAPIGRPRSRFYVAGVGRERIRWLFENDGIHCFMCGEPVAEKDASCDHVVPTSRGGPDIAANWALAHEKCNTKAGSDRAAQKMALAVANRIKAAIAAHDAARRARRHLNEGTLRSRIARAIARYFGRLASGR